MLAFCNMATLHVRNVPDDIYESLRREAQSHGRSIGAEAVQALQERLGQAPRARRMGLPRRRQTAGAFARFTPEAQEIVRAAADEAHSMRHRFIGTEHLLLALLRPEAGATAATLEGLGLHPDAIRVRIGELVPGADAEAVGRLPFTERAKRTLDLAVREAARVPAEFVAPQHLGLALLDTDGGVVHEILADSLTDPERARKQLRSASAEAFDQSTADDSFRVVELEGTADEWAIRLNQASAGGYRLFAIADARAVLVAD